MNFTILLYYNFTIIDNCIEKMVKSYGECRHKHNQLIKETSHSWQSRKHHWERIHIDFTVIFHILEELSKRVVMVPTKNDPYRTEQFIRELRRILQSSPFHCRLFLIMAVNLFSNALNNFSQLHAGHSCFVNSWPEHNVLIKYS